MFNSLITSAAIGAGLYSQSQHAEKKRQEIADEAERKRQIEKLTTQYKGLEKIKGTLDYRSQEISRQDKATAKYLADSDLPDNVFNKKIGNLNQLTAQRHMNVYNDLIPNIQARQKAVNELISLGDESYLDKVMSLDKELTEAVAGQNKYAKTASGFDSRGLKETAKAMEEKRMQKEQNATKARREAIEKNVFKTLYKQED